MRISAVTSSFVSPFNVNNNKQRVQNNATVIPQMKADSVSFSSSRYGKKILGVSAELGKKVGDSLSTSTSGHRAPWLSELFNKDVVTLITLGIAGFATAQAKKEGHMPTVLIGGDARVATKESLPVVERILLEQGVNVISIKDPVPTPMLALHAKKKNVDVAVLMTASHNPGGDGGYNVVTKEAAIAPAGVTQEVAKNMVKYAEAGFYVAQPVKTRRTVEYPYQEYKQALVDSKLIDFENIKNSGLKIYYDGLQGAGPYVVPRLLKDFEIPFEEVVSGGQEGPNPVAKNLTVLSEKVASSDAVMKIGLANDGDADRFGVVDEKGNFVDANEVILLTAYHLAKNKGLEGAIITNQATSTQVDALAEKFNLQSMRTPVGFKFIGEEIIDLRKDGKDILVAGEESGGLTVQGHIPEKDGIIAIMLMADLVATEKKPLSEILADAKAFSGKISSYELVSKKMTDNSAKDAIMAKVKSVYDGAVAGNTKFGDYQIDVEKTVQHQKRMEHFKKGGDGVKLFLTDGSSVLFRKSGTEPLIKCYVEATGKNNDEAIANKDNIKDTVNSFLS